MSDPIKKSDRLYTLADYRGWPEGERWELIDGVAYDMSPAPSRTHQALSREIERQISNHLADKPCEVYHAPFDVRLPASYERDDEETDTVVQPDIVVICDEKKLDERGCRGAPDWVIEILSPGTADKDLTLKVPLYERHGVHELWIIHPTDRTVMVFRIGADLYFGKPRFCGSQESIDSSVLPGLTINLMTAFRGSGKWSERKAHVPKGS